MKPTDNDYRLLLPTPAYTAFGYAVLAVGFVYAITVRAGALVVAAWLAWGWGRRDD